jgi:hypothetical protein
MAIADRQVPAPGELFLDHVAHFVPDLDAAAAVFESVGFVVTKTSHHAVGGQPAGSANRCVMLDEGYIELIAPTLDTPNSQKIRDRLRLFTGVHLVCFGTPHAEGEHCRLVDHGFAPPPLVELSRQVPEGGMVRFKVARAAPEAMAEGRIQYVQQMTPEAIWTSTNVAHSNGVVGLAAAYVVTQDPAKDAARWARFCALIPHAESDLVTLRTARGRVVIGSPDAVCDLLGAAPPAPAVAGYALACRDPHAFLARCRKQSLNVKDDHVLLPPALGGAWKIHPSAAT